MLHNKESHVSLNISPLMPTSATLLYLAFSLRNSWESLSLSCCEWWKWNFPWKDFSYPRAEEFQRKFLHSHYIKYSECEKEERKKKKCFMRKFLFVLISFLSKASPSVSLSSYSFLKFRSTETSFQHDFILKAQILSQLLNVIRNFKRALKNSILTKFDCFVLADFSIRSHFRRDDRDNSTALS